jgi:hypothetical protein
MSAASEAPLEMVHRTISPATRSRLTVTIPFPDWFIETARDYGVPSPEAYMAKNKRWNKLIARIQALEDALASLLSAKPKRKKAKKASAKTATKSRHKTSAKKPAPKVAKARPAPRKAKARKRKLRAAESAAMLPQPPVPTL